MRSNLTSCTSKSKYTFEEIPHFPIVHLGHAANRRNPTCTRRVTARLLLISGLSMRTLNLSPALGPTLSCDVKTSARGVLSLSVENAMAIRRYCLLNRLLLRISDLTRTAGHIEMCFCTCRYWC